MERISVIDGISSATRPRPGASCTPLTEVSIAAVPPAMRVPGCGSKVSSWLGPPAIHRTMIDWACSGGVPGFSAARARKWLTGVSHAAPARPAAPRNPRRERRWSCMFFGLANPARKGGGAYRSLHVRTPALTGGVRLMVPRKLRGVNQRPKEVFDLSAAVLVAREGGLEVRGFFRRRAARQHGEIRDLDSLRVAGRPPQDQRWGDERDGRPEA